MTAWKLRVMHFKTIYVTESKMSRREKKNSLHLHTIS